MIEDNYCKGCDLRLPPYRWSDSYRLGWRVSDQGDGVVCPTCARRPRPSHIALARKAVADIYIEDDTPTARHLETLREAVLALCDAVEAEA